jgi:hypothetical protein
MLQRTALPCACWRVRTFNLEVAGQIIGGDAACHGRHQAFS